MRRTSSSNPSKSRRQQQPPRVVVYSLAIIGALSCGALILFVAFLLFVDQSLSPKVMLENAYHKLVLPSTFHQTSSTYLPGQPLSTPPYLNVDYTVNGTRLAAYTDLRASLLTDGYRCDALTTLDTQTLANQGYLSCHNPSSGIYLTAQLMPQPPVPDSAHIDDPVDGAVITIQQQ